MTDFEIRETVRKIFNCEFSSEEEIDYWIDVLEKETGFVNVSDYIFWCDNNRSADEIADRIISDMKSKNHIILMKSEDYKMIAIGCDHAGVEMKKAVIEALSEKGFEFKDMGTDGTPCDYPVVAKAVCDEITSGNCEKGILICGTGIGMSMAANKVKGIRAALCSDSFSAKFTRLHNDANVMCMGARVLGNGLAAELAEIFLTTGFEGGRHQRRIDLINDIENNNL